MRSSNDAAVAAAQFRLLALPAPVSRTSLGPSGLPLRAAGERKGGLFVGGYTALVAAITLTSVGTLALLVDQPLLFPSLAPTVMVLAERPRSASAHPRNVLVGHLVGIAAGVGALAACGLWNVPSITTSGITVARVAAAVLSTVVTAFVLQVVRTPHAPAGATTLIVSLGIMSSPEALVAILASVALVTLIATLLNLLTGIRKTLKWPDEPGLVAGIDRPR